VSKYNHIVIIYNPVSTGPSKRHADQLARRLRKKLPKLPLELIATQYAGHAEQLAYELPHQHKKLLLISSSGDGGYNEVVNGVMQAQQHGKSCVCAVLPSGNANDHARTVHKQRPLYEAVLEGETKKIDLLKVRVEDGKSVRIRYAHSYIGAGVTSDIAAELNRHKLNSISELYYTARTVRRFKPFVILHNKEQVQLDSLIFSNIGQMAKVFTFASKTLLDDGKFEVIQFPHKTRPRMLMRFFRAALLYVEPTYRTSQYAFQALQAMALQLDGEVLEVPKDSVVTVQSEPKVLTTVY
jgi:diacylglycerol kinase (ATP)